MIERIAITSRPDWLAVRKQDVTASEVAALFGAHPYKSALQVYAEKKGLARDQGDNPAMRRGRILEPAVAAALAEDRPDLGPLTKATAYLRDPALRIGATPDYTLADGTPVEMKTAAPEVFARDWVDGPPLAYQLQLLVQMRLLEAGRGFLAVLIDNRAKDLHVCEVAWHDGAWTRIAEAVADFWARFARDEMPSPDFARDGAALKSLMPPASGKRIDLTGDNLLPELLEERARLKGEVKEREQRLAAIDAEIIAKLDGAEEAAAQGWRISHKLQSRKETVIAASTYPVLRVTALKEKAA